MVSSALLRIDLVLQVWVKPIFKSVVQADGGDGSSGGDSGGGLTTCDYLDKGDLPDYCLGHDLGDTFRRFWEEIQASTVKEMARIVANSYERFTQDAITMDLPGNTGHLMYGKPSGGAWLTVYEGASAGGMGRMLAIGFLLLIAATYGRSLVRMVAFGSTYTNRRQKRRFWAGLILMMVWYWAVVTLLFFTQSITVAILPEMTEFITKVKPLLNPEDLLKPKNQIILNNLSLGVIFTVGGLSFIGLYLLFAIREILVFALIYVGPIGIALAFSGIPVVERYSRAGLKRIVPLAMLPIPAAVVFRGLMFYVTHLTGDVVLVFAQGTQLLLGVAPLLALYVCWKSFKLTNPKIAGFVEQAAQTTTNLATGQLKIGGRAAAAGAATAVGGPGAGLATAAGGVRGGARYAAYSAAGSRGGNHDGGPDKSGRRRNPDPSSNSGSAPDDWRDDQDIDWDAVTGRLDDTDGPVRSRSSSTGRGRGNQRSLDGATAGQSQLPPGSSSVERADSESEADYVHHGQSHFDGPTARPSGKPDPEALPPHETSQQVEGKDGEPVQRSMTHSEAQLADYDQPEDRSPRRRTPQGHSGTATPQGGSQYDSRRRGRPGSPTFGHASGSGSGTTPAPGSGGHSSHHQAQIEILRAIQHNVAQNDSWDDYHQGGHDDQARQVESRVEDVDTGTTGDDGRRDDLTSNTNRE